MKTARVNRMSDETLEYEEERFIVDLTELICRRMKENGIKRADLASSIGKSKSYVTQLLDGSTNMTVRTMTRIMGILGRRLVVADVPAVAENLVEGPECEPLKYPKPTPVIYGGRDIVAASKAPAGIAA